MSIGLVPTKKAVKRMHLGTLGVCNGLCPLTDLLLDERGDGLMAHLLVLADLHAVLLGGSFALHAVLLGGSFALHAALLRGSFARHGLADECDSVPSTSTNC